MIQQATKGRPDQPSSIPQVTHLATWSTSDLSGAKVTVAALIGHLVVAHSAHLALDGKNDRGGDGSMGNQQQA